MTTTAKPKDPRKTTTADAAPKPLHVRTRSGYMTNSVGHPSGPLNPVLTEKQAAQLKAVLFGS